MIAVTLPWPPKELSPNARVHWKLKADAAKKYKSDCFWFCKAGWLNTSYTKRPAFIEGPNLTITFYPPSKRKADVDNMLASFKAGLDAISDFTGIDDSKFQITFSKAEPIKHGMVKVVIA